MMLFYKAWRESRTRFLCAAAAVALYSSGALLDARVSFPPPEYPMLPYTAFVWATFYGPLRAVVFSLIALVLSLGGVRRERAAGTSSFTLALPVSRGELLRARVVVGLLELVALAIIPMVVVPALSPAIARHSYPLSQSVRFGLLFMSWGVVWFAIGFVWSVLFAGEYTAAALSMLTPVSYMVIYANVSRGGQRFPEANPFAMMSGGLDSSFGGMAVLTDPLPWHVIFVLTVIAAGLLFGAWRLTLRQDF
jgi:ABC-type transport system involved in multi-copper enzyme maturation permease subunit